MNDRPDAFNRLDEEDEQEIERLEVDEGVVNVLVKQAQDIIRNEDNHGSIGGHGSRVAPASIDSIMNDISIPSEEVRSPDLSATLMRIADFQYQGGDPQKLLIPELKGRITSALLMKLHGTNSKHWKIRLGGRRFPRLFEHLTGVDSLHIVNCAGSSIGAHMKDIDYVCFENIGGGPVGEYMRSIGTSIFTNIDADVTVTAENAIFICVTTVLASDFENAIFYEVADPRLPISGELKIDGSVPMALDKRDHSSMETLSETWKADRPFTAFVRRDPSSEEYDHIETILYDASAGADVPQEAANTVRPLTDDEHRVIEELAEGPPPDEQEVAEAIANLNEGLNNDE